MNNNNEILSVISCGRSKWLKAFALIATLSGCAGPSVSYKEVSKSINERELRGALQFSLYGSRVTLTKPSDDAKENSSASLGLTKATPQIASLSGLDGAQALVTPTVSSYLYAIKPTDNALHKTKLNGTYVDNSRLLKSVGVEFEDQTVQIIQAVGAVAVSALALASIGEGQEGITLPVVLDASDPEKWGVWLPVRAADPNGWKYRVVKPSDIDLKGTTESATFFKDYENDTTNLFPVSACVNTRVDITNDTTLTSYKSFFVTIADPDRVYTFTLPAKGAVKMHTVCGADLSVESSNNGTLTALQALDAVFKQVEAIKAAQDAQKK